MKSALVFAVLVSVAVASAAGASVFGEKEDAEKAINNKFEEIKKLVENIENDIKEDEGKIKEDKEKIALDNGTAKKKSAADNVLEEVVAVTRTAIAKGKPVSAIDCITRVHFESVDLLDNSLSDYHKAVKNVAIDKRRIHVAMKFEIQLIEKALKELFDQSKEKLKADKLSKDQILAIKNDAMKKASTADAQLRENKKRVYQPVINEEYDKLIAGYTKKLTEIVEGTKKKLQKCVA